MVGPKAEGNSSIHSPELGSFFDVPITGKAQVDFLNIADVRSFSKSIYGA